MAAINSLKRGKGEERMTTKKALSVAEAAEALGITRQCLYSNLLHRKDFPSFKVGRRTLISAEALDRWIAEQAGGAALSDD